MNGIGKLAVVRVGKSFPRRAAAGLFIFAALLAAPVLAQSDAAAEINWNLPPVDNSSIDPPLVEYLTVLRATIEAKDVEGLLAAIRPDIKNGLGGDDDGAEMFIRGWSLDTNPETSEVWEVLGKLLKLGGNWYGSDEYCVPHLEGAFPDQLDPFQYALVTGENVRLRRNPSTGSATEGSLTWEIVQIMAVNGDWTQIRTHTGKSGFVHSDFIHSPTDYRACFRADNGGPWQMRMLLAGD